MITFSQKNKLLPVEHVPNQTAGQLAKSTMKTVELYAKGGFQVKVALMDKEFNKIKDDVGHLEVNTTARREHVAKIGRHIWLVKEQMRCTAAALLSCGIKHLPKQIVIHLVYYVTLWLNAFPGKQTLSLNFLPKEIVT